MKRITFTLIGLLALPGQAAFSELKSGTKALGFRFLSLSGETVALTTQEERLVLNVTAAEGKPLHRWWRP